MAVLVPLFIAYSDVLGFRGPLLSLFICLPAFFLFSVAAVMRRGRARVVVARIFLGVPMLFLVSAAFTLAMGVAHDRLTERAIRSWGTELRAAKAQVGTYPTFSVRRVYGIPVVFAPPTSQYEEGLITFEGFGLKRQSYLVDEDRFMEAADG